MHRDLKPQNIMLDENFNLKVVRNSDDHALLFRSTSVMQNVWTSLMKMKSKMEQVWMLKTLQDYSRLSMSLIIWKEEALLLGQSIIWLLK